MAKLLGLILDWDGTIADTQSDQFKWLKHCAEDLFSKKFPYDSLTEEFKKDYNNYYSRGISGLYDMIGVDFEANKDRIWNEFLKWKKQAEINLFPDIKDVIAEIYSRSRPSRNRARGLRIVLNTTQKYEAIEQQFLKNGLEQYFDSKVTREMLPESKSAMLTKPHAYSIEWALDLAGVNPDEALAVGDTRDDIIACRTLRRRRPDLVERVKTCAVAWGYEPESDLKNQTPEYLIQKPKELIGIIKELGGFD